MTLPVSRLLLFVFAASHASAQTGTIFTFAGAAPVGDGGPANQVLLRSPTAAVTDESGNLFFGGGNDARIWKMDRSGVAMVYAGTGALFGLPDENRQARQSNIGVVNDFAIGPDGLLYFTERSWQRIRKIQSNGLVVTVAGIAGSSGFSGDGGPASGARLNQPAGLTFDAQGSLFFCDLQNHRIRKIDPSGIIRTIAGTGQAGYSGDDGDAREARVSSPWGIAVDPKGNVYFADQGNNRVRRISPEGVISTVAGTGTRGASGDGGPATESTLSSPAGLAFDAAGNLYIAERFNFRIRKLDPNGVITTVAGSEAPGSGREQSLAVQRRLNHPQGVFVSKDGTIYVANTGDHQILAIGSDGSIRVVAGASATAGDGGAAFFARLYQPQQIAVGASGDVYFADADSNRVRRVDPQGVISTVAGSGFGPTGLTAARLNPNDPFDTDFYFPIGVAADPLGNVYVSSFSTSVLRISPSGSVTVAAGKHGLSGYGGDGGPATEALLGLPRGLTVDPEGNLFIADYANHRIRKVTPDGTISTIAGTGAAGFSGDGGQATLAQLNLPYGVLAAGDGSVFVADTGNNRIRVITPQGVIRTVAGNGNRSPVVDGMATSVALNSPRMMALDAAGNLYITENSYLRRLSPSGVISTAAGTGQSDIVRDGINSSQASLQFAVGVAVDSRGNVLVGDVNNGRIRIIRGVVPFGVSPMALLFTGTVGSVPAPQILTLSSPDEEPKEYFVTTNAPWLQVTPERGAINGSEVLRVAANPNGLGKGTYAGRITITTGQNEKADIPVTLTISGTPQQILLAQQGFSFAAVQNGSAPPSQRLSILNSGIGTLNWRTSVSTLAGGNWLSTTPASGASLATGTPPAIELRANPQGLAPGAYFGLVTVSADGVDNSPQSATVVLSVFPADQPPGPAVTPLGLVFSSAPGGAPATAQSVQVANITTRVITFRATASFPQGQPQWFRLPVTSGSLEAGQSITVEVRPEAQQLAAGVYRGDLDLSFSPGNVNSRVSALLVVATGARSARTSERAADETCTPKRLLPVFRSPGQGFQSTAGWPTPLDIQVVDDCAQPMATGSVIASFNNGDPPLALTAVGGGRWSGTWAPRLARGVTITVLARTIETRLEGSATLTGGANSSQEQPLIEPTGVRSAATLSQATPVAVGSQIRILGSQLASQEQQAEVLPLPDEIGGTEAIIGGRSVPLEAVSGSSLSAVLPFDLAENTRLQMIVRRNRSYSPPEPVIVTSVQPGVFWGATVTDPKVMVETSDGLIPNEERPAIAGESLVFYCTGMGETDPAVAAGTPGPDPAAAVKAQITVSIQGIQAEVKRAILVPGKTGLYEIRVVIPEGVATDASAPVEIVVGGQPTAPVTVALR